MKTLEFNKKYFKTIESLCYNGLKANDGSFWRSCFSEVGPKYRIISISDD